MGLVFDLRFLISYPSLEPEPPSPDESATRTKRTAYLHFKTLSDGGTHPKATRTVPLLVREPGIEMRCSGNLLALAYLQPETPLSPDMRFEIVDWKQGRRLMVSHCLVDVFDCSDSLLSLRVTKWVVIS